MVPSMLQTFPRAIMALTNEVLLLASRPGQFLGILHWLSIFLKPDTFGGVCSTADVSLLLFYLATWGQEVADLRLDRQYFYKGKPAASLAAGMGKGWRWHVRGQREQNLGAVTTLAVTALAPGLLLQPLSSGSQGTFLRSAHSACSGKVQQNVLWSSLLLLLCAQVPCDKDIPKGQFALKGSGF